MAIFSTIFPVLPKYPGPYQVGSIDIEFPLHESKSFGIIDTCVETILVRLFYPAYLNVAGKKTTSPSWLPQPGMEYAKGYANFLRQPFLPVSLAISLAVHRKTIPVAENVPPIPPLNGALPVMIFSHGLGGSRNAYSQWCGSMASYGVFVAAIEHRDGSAPISIVHAGTENQSAVPYRRLNVHSDKMSDLRACQLAHRTYEVSKLIGLLRDINHGKQIDGKGEHKSLLEQFKGILNTNKGELVMAGHSFGAATTVVVCKDKENVVSDYPLKEEFKGAIMLDIWTMPLTSTPTTTLTVPSLHIVSEQFLKWSDNFSAITPLLNESRSSSSFAKLFYIKGSAHISQSDFHLLFPNLCRQFFHARADANKVMEINVRAGVEFLRAIGINGLKAEKDTIFEEPSDAWEEMEKDI